VIKKALTLLLFGLLHVSVIFAQILTPIAESRESFIDYDEQAVTIVGIITTGVDIVDLNGYAGGTCVLYTLNFSTSVHERDRILDLWEYRLITP